jgi:predicted O-methyltransferase YrrM
MIYIQSVWEYIYHPFHALLRNKNELVRMTGSENDSVKYLGMVIADALDRRMMPEELGWKERIEHLRTELNRSEERLSIEDYGAQSPMKQLSDETMYTGRVVQKTVGEVSRSSSKPLKWSLFLFRLIRGLRAQRCLELGTCLGISGSYIGAAMQLNGTGSLITIEGSPALAERAEKNFCALGIGNIESVTGRFQDTLGAVIEKAGTLDAVFVDGHHDGASTLRYFETIAPALAPGAVAVFDDIGWSQEMHDAWKRLKEHDRVCATVDLFGMGMCVIGTSPKEEFTIAV